MTANVLGFPGTESEMSDSELTSFKIKTINPQSRMKLLWTGTARSIWLLYYLSMYLSNKLYWSVQIKGPFSNQDNTVSSNSDFWQHWVRKLRRKLSAFWFHLGQLYMEFAYFIVDRSIFDGKFKMVSLFLSELLHQQKGITTRVRLTCYNESESSNKLECRGACSMDIHRYLRKRS